MPVNTITVKLVGSDEDNEIVRFDDFIEFCQSVSTCLRTSETIVSHQAAQIRYAIAKLASASATITLEAIHPKNGQDRRGEVLHLFEDTVAKLQAGEIVDPRIHRSALERFRELIKPLHRRSKQVWIAREQLTTQYEANIDKILGSSIPSEGFVSGLLERVNVHNRKEFALYPPIAGARIICTFQESMFDKVRDGIKRNVTVSGKLYFDEDEPFPSRVQVTQMEIHPPDEELPTLRELKGITRGCTGGLSSVDFVRAIRDEQPN